MQKNNKRKIAIFIGSRANYGTGKAVMKAVKDHPSLILQTIVGASALLDHYGEVVKLIEADGFTIDARVHMLIEGASPLTMAKTTGIGMSELATAYDNLKPDVVIAVGDRFEVLAAAAAAAYMNIPLAHIMGGEISGTIDESIRHAITKLAHIHFPSSEAARKRIIQMGERPEMIFAVGCPRMDLIRDILEKKKLDLTFEGVGAGAIDITKPFLFVSQHSVTTEFGSGEKDINAILDALTELKIQTIMLWPNSDAGSEDVSRGIRKFRERTKGNPPFPLHIFKNLPVHNYFHLMNSTACMIGNSSSLLREGSFIGTPGVLVGSRQQGRDRSENVIAVKHDKKEIVAAIRKQLKHGKYKSNHSYGKGDAGKNIAAVLTKVKPEIQKLFREIKHNGL